MLWLPCWKGKQLQPCWDLRSFLAGEILTAAMGPLAPAQGRVLQELLISWGQAMELVKFCICLITPRALAAFPACFPLFLFPPLQEYFCPPAKGSWVADGSVEGHSCHFGLFCPKNEHLGLSLPLWQRRQAKNNNEKKIKTGRSEIKATSREEEEKSEPGCWRGWAQSLGTERPSKGHPGNPSRDILVAVELVAAPGLCL